MIKKYSILHKSTELVFDVMYHHTKIENKESILTKGLIVGSPWNKTLGAKEVIVKIYGQSPIFLAGSPLNFKSKEDKDVTFEVNIEGLPLVADIPSLYDKGAYYSEDGEGIWFEEDNTPFVFMDYVDGNGMLYFSDLLNPEHPLVAICISFTETAACLKNIPPRKLKLLE